MVNEKFDLMLAEIKEQPDALQRTFVLNQMYLKQIEVELTPLVEAGDIDNVLIVGRGSSDNAAMVGKYIIETKIGLPVSMAAPSVINLYHAPLKLSRTLVIGVSQSGRTNEIVQFLSEVRGKAGYTLGITNETDSPLAHLGLNAVLFCHAGMEKALAATKSFLSTMAVFYMLVSAIYPRLELTTELETIPGLVDRTLSCEEEIAITGKWLGAFDECILLGRGYNYPIALEAGLKLQETAYLRAKAFSGADFQHGPWAITQEGIPFLIFQPDGVTYDGMRWLAEQVAAKGAAPLIITSKPAEKPERIPHVLTVPFSDEWLSPFVYAVTAQLLAYYTAESRGINPSCSRWLNKVTETR